MGYSNRYYEKHQLYPMVMEQPEQKHFCRLSEHTRQALRTLQGKINNSCSCCANKTLLALHCEGFGGNGFSCDCDTKSCSVFCADLLRDSK